MEWLAFLLFVTAVSSRPHNPDGKCSASLNVTFMKLRRKWEDNLRHNLRLFSSGARLIVH